MNGDQTMDKKQMGVMNRIFFSNLISFVPPTTHAIRLIVCSGDSFRTKTRPTRIHLSSNILFYRHLISSPSFISRRKANYLSRPGQRRNCLSLSFSFSFSILPLSLLLLRENNFASFRKKNQVGPFLKVNQTVFLCRKTDVLLKPTFPTPSPRSLYNSIRKYFLFLLT